MSLLRPFTAQDLFSVNPINLDAWTETYGVAYYLGYLNNWGECFSVVTTAHPSEGELMGYGSFFLDWSALALYFAWWTDAVTTTSDGKDRRRQGRLAVNPLLPSAHLFSLTDPRTQLPRLSHHRIALPSSISSRYEPHEAFTNGRRSREQLFRRFIRSGK